MRNLMLGLIGAGALAFGSAASAEIDLTPPTTVDTTGPTSSDSGFHFSFGYSDSGADSPFDEMVSFQNSLDGYYGFTLTSTATLIPDGNGGMMIDPATDVDFCPTCVFVTGMTAGGMDIGSLFLTATAGSTDALENYNLLGQFLSAGTYTLHIQGTRGDAGSFGGNVSFAAAPAPVPEPATWAMMLLGFGAIGWQVRRRRAPLLAQAA